MITIKDEKSTNLAKEKRGKWWFLHRIGILDGWRRYLLSEGLVSELVIPVQDVETGERRRSSADEERCQSNSQHVPHFPPFLLLLLPQLQRRILTLSRCCENVAVLSLEASCKPRWTKTQRRRFSHNKLFPLYSWFENLIGNPTDK